MSDPRTIIEQICASSSMTTTDKLVAVAMAMTGVLEPMELARITNISKTAAYRSSSNTWENVGEIVKNIAIPVSGNVGNHGNCSEKQSQDSRIREDLSVACDLQSRAPKELPNGNSSYEDASKLAGGVGEIPGLNGSTPRLVKQLAGWLAGDLGSPDLETANNLLIGSVDVHGPEKVRIGMLELEAQISAGNKPRDIGKAFPAFVKNAKTEPTKKSETWAERQDREHAAAWKMIHRLEGTA